jgi:NADH:ubiquinone oxidoreductase subunit 6 (subunit J)
MLTFLIFFLLILFAVLGFVAISRALHNPNYHKENKDDKSFLDNEIDNMGFIGKSLFSNYITSRNTQRIVEALEKKSKEKNNDIADK